MTEAPLGEGVAAVAVPTSIVSASKLRGLWCDDLRCARCFVAKSEVGCRRDD